MSSLRDLIVRRLMDAGVRALFGVPGGGGNLDLIDAAGRAGLPFVLTATETGGALAAVGQAEVTGTPGACLTTLGPGAASVTNGVACAFLDRAPLFVFTDSHATASAGAFEHQQFDHLAVFRPITKWSGRLRPGCAATTIEQAFAASAQLPPGPVHIDCPEDFESSAPAANRADEDAVDSRAIRGRSQRLRVDRHSCAPPARDRRARRAATCRRGRDPCICSITARFRHWSPTRPRAWSQTTIRALPACSPTRTIERSLVASSDLIVGIGLDPVELLPRPWPYAQPVVSVCPWRLETRQVPFAAQRVTSIASGVAELESWMRSAEWDLDAVRRQVAEQRRAIDIPGGFTSQHVVQMTAAAWSRSHRVTVDAGAHMVPATMLWPVAEPNGLLISNGLSTMGFALPAAIGAAIADRDRPVVALTGDGGLLMCAAELLTAVREKLRLTIVVFNDASLSLIEIKQQRRGYQPAGVALGPVNWPTLAESFGLTAFSAADEPGMARAIAAATAIDGPSLIDARIDRSNYAATLAAIRG